MSTESERPTRDNAETTRDRHATVPDWRAVYGPYLRAAAVVSSVAIEHPEWTPATRRRLMRDIMDRGWRRP